MALTRDELVERLEALAQFDPGMRFDLCRTGADMSPTLGVGPAHPESTRRFWDLAVDAVALFDPDGTGDESERWMRLVCDNAPNLIARDALGGVIQNAAYASALVVRRLGNSAEADHQPKAPAKRKPIGDAPPALSPLERKILEVLAKNGTLMTREALAHESAITDIRRDPKVIRKGVNRLLGYNYLSEPLGKGLGLDITAAGRGRLPPVDPL